MIYVGIDAHKAFLQVAAMGRDGKVILNERVDTDHASMGRFFSQFPKKAKYVMEASSVSYGPYRFLTVGMGLDVMMSSPLHNKVIASSKKTDKVDAVVLADLLRGGYIVKCYVPSEDAMDDRQLVRHRKRTVERRTACKNTIHGILLQAGRKIPGTPFSQPYVRELRSMGDYRIDDCLEMIALCDRQIARADAMVRKSVERSPGTKLLMTIKGVGQFTALATMSEIDDVSRFPDPDRLVSYVGLAPRVRSSAGVAHVGSITKQGSGLLRGALTEAAHAHARYEPDSNISRFYRRLARKKGSSKAAVAAAAKLLRAMHAMLTGGREFVPDYGQRRKRDMDPCGMTASS